MSEEVKNELAVSNCAYPALSNQGTEDVSVEQALMNEEMEELGGVTLKLPKIKLGASGNGKIEIPDNDNPDDSSSVKEIEGVIVGCFASRAKWNEGETIPECASRNGKVSIEGKQCATCPLCKFKRNPDGSLIRPDCKESRNLYILTKTHSMPLQFQIPPSGIKAYDDFARTILSSKHTQLGTIVKISVEVKENANKQKYNKAKFDIVGRVEQELLPSIMALKQQIVSMINSMDITEISEDAEMKEVENDGTLPF